MKIVGATLPVFESEACKLHPNKMTTCSAEHVVIWLACILQASLSNAGTGERLFDSCLGFVWNEAKTTVE